ncbi:hypothetical protein K6979_16965 [Xanthomonas cucurbitae]|uniref:hypothetical protein n=1 Tax=Xanthomonas cucurbitae TaxID=56453 RepID=UPI0011B0238C|nr:hypothetical protein [Xanthomonas cucurbitae]WDM78797.1 hypothetical protein K6980_16970 [Xanthomonas cucurbitae]WDM82476.1 hypothetical protein K6979_16965 [Xanthomonas cucurbitae]
MSRYWHFLPICSGVILLLFFWNSQHNAFFGTSKLIFDTSASLAGLVGTAVTFIEVVRSYSFNEELRANIKVGTDRRRASELARLVQMTKDLADLVEAGTPISSNTVSDITSLIRSTFPRGVSIQGMTNSEVDERLLKIPFCGGGLNKEDLSLFLGLIKTAAASEISNIDTAINSLSVRSK